jgi:hypothetical protein
VFFIFYLVRYDGFDWKATLTESVSIHLFVCCILLRMDRVLKQEYLCFGNINLLPSQHKYPFLAPKMSQDCYCWSKTGMLFFFQWYNKKLKEKRKDTLSCIGKGLFMFIKKKKIYNRKKNKFISFIFFWIKNLKFHWFMGLVAYDSIKEYCIEFDS